MDILIKLELQKIATGIIDDIYVENRMVHVGLEGENIYRVVDCYFDMIAFYSNNKADDSEFSKDFDDDGSPQRILETPDCDIFTIELFSEFVRDITKIYILKNDIMSIDLYELNNMLTAFQISDKKNLPEDYNFIINKIRSNCECIYRKIDEKFIK